MSTVTTIVTEQGFEKSWESMARSNSIIKRVKNEVKSIMKTIIAQLREENSSLTNEELITKLSSKKILDLTLEKLKDVEKDIGEVKGIFIRSYSDLLMEISINDIIKSAQKDYGYSPVDLRDILIKRTKRDDNGIANKISKRLDNAMKIFDIRSTRLTKLKNEWISRIIGRMEANKDKKMIPDSPDDIDL